MIQGHSSGTTIIVPEEDQDSTWYALNAAITQLENDVMSFKSLMTKDGREMSFAEKIMVKRDEKYIATLIIIRDTIPEPDTFGL